MINDYIIVYAGTPGSLENEVREKIAEGYQPFGSIAVSPSGCYCQPMVK